MPEIIIDGDCHRLPDPPPDTFEALLASVDSVLAPAGRLLAQVTVDGRPGVETLTPEEFASAGRIELSSVALAAAVARVASTCGEAAAALGGEADALANEVLRIPWAEAAKNCVTFGERLGCLVTDLGGLAAHGGETGPAACALRSLGVAIERWMDAIQARDAADVCLRLHVDVMQALRTIERVAAAIAKGGDG